MPWQSVQTESAVTALPAGAEEESMISEGSPDEVGETVYYDFITGKRKGKIPIRGFASADKL